MYLNARMYGRSETYLLDRLLGLYLIFRALVGPWWGLAWQAEGDFSDVIQAISLIILFGSLAVGFGIFAGRRWAFLTLAAFTGLGLFFAALPSVTLGTAAVFWAALQLGYCALRLSGAAGALPR